MKKTLGILIGLGLLGFPACNKEHSNSSGNGSGATAVHVFLTDDPTLIFSEVLIDIQKVEIKAEDSDQQRHEQEHGDDDDNGDNHGSTSGGWVSLDIHPGVYNILNFRNGLDTLFATGSFPSTHALRKVRITIGSNSSVVFNGQSFPLVAKDNDQIVVIKLSDDFNGVGSLTQLDFSLDFDAGRSIRFNNNQFELKAEIHAFRKERAASIEGRVSPAAAQAVIMAINGSDTTTAKPESEGEFKIVGLAPGNYSLLVHATANNYADTLIQHIAVSASEDAHTGTITLHQ